MGPTEILTQIEQIIEQAKTAVLATVDENNQPNLRWMSPVIFAERAGFIYCISSPTMEDGLIVRWVAKQGQKVSQGDTLCEVQTDKATMEYESPTDGEVLKIVVDENNSACVGDTIAIIGQKGEDISELLKEASEKPAISQQKPQPEPQAVRPKEPTQTKERAAVSASDKIQISPLAKKMAARHGIDISKITGSGPGGRIIEKDIEAYIKRQQ